MKIIDGKKVSFEIKNELKKEVESLKRKGINPCLAVVLVGEDPASEIYVRNKQRACEYIGIESKTFKMETKTTEEELLNLIEDLNNDSTVDGILVQLPVPSHISVKKVIYSIDPDKDVDGFHPINVGKMVLANDLENTFLSCTPAGIMELLKRYNIETAGKTAVIVGRSNIVGKPISSMLLAADCTVITCHSKTKDLEYYCKMADILIAAVGQAEIIDKKCIKKGAVVIDVGMNRNFESKLCGDVNFEDVISEVSFITPVPGGVGPMTIAMLMKNVVKSAKKREGVLCQC